MDWISRAHSTAFTTLANSLYGTEMRDPTTMYKVFRRDAYEGIRFTRDRFDFDWELLIKLLRKGYKPLEMPVNYRSRSFKEGKKVSLFGDPISWIKICLKLRFTRIDPMEEVDRQRRASFVPAQDHLPGTSAIRA